MVIRIRQREIVTTCRDDYYAISGHLMFGVTCRVIVAGAVLLQFLEPCAFQARTLLFSLVNYRVDR